MNSAQETSKRRPRKQAWDLLDNLSPRTGDMDNARNRSKRKSHAVQLKLDVPLLLVVISLLIFGLIMVYSASYDYSVGYYGNPNLIFLRQLIWLVIGVASVIALTFVDYHYWRRVAVIAIFITIAMLLGVLFISEIRNNAARTLYEGSIQPSELAKLITIIYLSVWLFVRKDQLGDISFGLIPLGVILGVLGGLILLQPDLSAVVTVLFLGGLMFFLAGGEIRQIGVLVLLAILVGFAVYLLYPTGKARIHDYFIGIKDPIQGSYHVQRSFDAFVKGGWFGVGIGRGETKLTGLPVPHTDSIFAVVGEETGVLGAAGIVALYTIFLWRGLLISRRAPDELGALLAAGLTLWITTEAYINMAVMVNLLPFAGNALPLISAGGSSLIVTLAAVGILLNISRLSVQRQDEDGRLFNAVINLRGGDRRRRVSSARRPASHAGRKQRRNQG